MGEAPDPFTYSTGGVTQQVTGPLNREGNITSDVIQPVITGADVTRQLEAQNAARGNPFESIAKIAHGLSGLASGISDAMEPAARDQAYAQGMQSVTRDSSGQIQVQPTAGWTFGKGGEAVTAAGASGQRAMLSLQTDQDVQQLAIKSGGNINNFDAIRDTYLASAKWGQINPQALMETQKKFGQYRENLVTANNSKDVKNSQLALESVYQNRQDDLEQLARQGQIGSPEFAKTHAELVDTLTQLHANPLFGVSKETLDDTLHRSMIGFTTAALKGNIDAAWKDGNAVVARDRAQDAVQDMEGITEAERDTMTREAGTRLEFLSGQNKADIDDLHGKIDDADTALHNGRAYSPSAFDELYKHAGSLGDVDSQLRIEMIRKYHPISPQATGLSPSQTVASLGGAPGTPDLNDYKTQRQQQAAAFFVGRGYSQNEAHAIVATLSGESTRNLHTGAFQGEAHGAEAAYGIANWNYARRDQLINWAHSFNLNPQDFSTQLQFADKEIREMGLPHGTNQDPATLTKIYTGKFESPAVNNGGQRWANYAGGGGQDGVPPPTVEEAIANKFANSEWAATQASDKKMRGEIAENMGKGLEMKLGNGIVPSVGEMTQYAQVAPDNKSEDDRKVRIFGQAQGVGAVAAAGGAAGGGGGGSLAAPSGGGAPTQLDQVRQQATVMAASSGDMLKARLAQETINGLTKAHDMLKKDPARGALGMKWIKPNEYGAISQPLDYSNPGALAAGLAMRGRLAARINSAEPDLAPSAILPQDKGAAQNVISGGSPDQKIALLSAIGSLPDAQREATLAALKQTGKAGVTFGQAARVATWNPAAAQEILTGMAIKNQPDGKQYMPHEKDSAPRFSTLLPPTDLTTPAARGRIYDAASAIYTARQFKAGDTDWDQSTWDDAVNAASGGVLKSRGTAIIAPRGGDGQPMTQDQFDQRIQSLLDRDLQGASLAGHPLPAMKLQAPANWFGEDRGYRLRTADPDSGKYTIITGSSAAPQTVMSGRTDQNGRQMPFILDLGPPARRPIEAVGGRPPSSPTELQDATAGAASQYPTLAPHLATSVVAYGTPTGPNDDRQLEFYHSWDSDNPNPGKSTIEVFNKNLAGSDLQQAIAGDMLHKLGAIDPATGEPVDKYFYGLKKELGTARTERHIEADKAAYDQEKASPYGAGDYKSWANGSRLDAYIRGGLFPQQNPEWQNGFITKKMLPILNKMKDYLANGKPK